MDDLPVSASTGAERSSDSESVLALRLSTLSLGGWMEPTRSDCYRIALAEPARTSPTAPAEASLSVSPTSIGEGTEQVHRPVDPPGPPSLSPPSPPRSPPRSLAWVTGKPHLPYVGGSPEAVHQMSLPEVWFAVWIASCQYTGLSFQVGIVVCVVVYAFSFLPWQNPESQDINYRVALMPVMACSFTWWWCCWSNAYVSWGERAANRFAKWCVLMSVVSVSILWPLQSSAACETVFYYRLDLLYWVVFYAGSLVVIGLFKQHYIQLGLMARLRTPSQLASNPQPFMMIMTFTLKQMIWFYAMQTVLFLGLLVLAIVFLHQDNVVVKTILRLVVFQLLHAVSLLLYRNQAVHAAAFHHKGAEQSALNKMLYAELFFNLVGRNLISNLGDTRFELVALLVAGVADIMLRTTLYQQENLMRRFFGQPMMTPAERRQLAPIFGVLSVHATLSEYINILIAGGIKLWFAQSRLFNFGFSQDGSAEQLAAVAVTVAASVLIQFVVDLITLFFQSRQSLPIFQYWVNLNGPVLITHISSVLYALFCAFIAFTNVPAFYAPTPA